METQRHAIRRKDVLATILTLLCLGGVPLLPVHGYPQALAIVYANDNMGELAPCG